jgi:hypothetical protein
LESSHCPKNESCNDEKCIDPCTQTKICASSNNCVVKQHTPDCECPRDQWGNPFKGKCNPYLCSNVTNCPEFLACRSGICKGIIFFSNNLV